MTEFDSEAAWRDKVQICLFGLTSDQDRLDFAEEVKRLAGLLRWASLGEFVFVLSKLIVWIRWHLLGTTLQNLERQFRAGQHWVLENGEFGDGSIGSITARRTQRYEGLYGYRKKFETKMSVSRSARTLQQYTKQSQSSLLYHNVVWIARLVFCRPWIPHSTQDDGDLPMLDLARCLQTLYVHTFADVQTWYVRTQNWYEHVAASICADEETLMIVQRPSWYSDTYPETETESETGTGTGTETESCQWSWTSRRMYKLSETSERRTSLGTSHDERIMTAIARSRARARCKAMARWSVKFWAVNNSKVGGNFQPTNARWW